MTHAHASAMLSDNGSVTLREMTPDDVEAGLRLCRLSHWNQVARDWERFLAGPRGSAVVAEDGANRVVGSVATMRYAGASGGPSVVWLAMILVDPAARGQGIGTALLHEGLARAGAVDVVGLDATPLGQPLYTRLGFRATSAITRMARVATARQTAPGPDVGARAARGADDAAIARLDAQVTGLDRSAMLTWLREGAPDLSWVLHRDGGLQGAVLGRHGHRFTHLGPIIATSPAAAIGLLRVALAAAGSRPVIVDATDLHARFQEALQDLGFTVQRPFARMYRGGARPAGDPSRLFAIIGPEFG